MRLLVQSKEFYDSIANDEDREKFNSYFSGSRSFDSMPLLKVTLPESKTLTQLGTIWLDFETVGELMFCNSSIIYMYCLRAECLSDIWMQQDENGKWSFTTLSGLSKEQISFAIPILRDFLQKIVNEKYGEYVPIIWASKENLNRKIT